MLNAPPPSGCVSPNQCPPGSVGIIGDPVCSSCDETCTTCVQPEDPNSCLTCQANYILTSPNAPAACVIW
jgi:hypothetical protein